MKRYLIAGLLSWLPLAITIWVLLWILGLIQGVFNAVLRLLATLAPQHADLIQSLGQIPGMSVLVTASVLLLSGIFVTNVFGQWLMRQWDRVMGRIPIVKSIYSSVKQVSDTLFSSSGQAFREAVLVQYPRAGSWTIAFVTGKPSGEVLGLLQQQSQPDGQRATEWISVYVPTTPNPTSGFFLMMPRHEVKPLGMSVDAALKYVISMGVVAPQTGTPELPAPSQEQPQA
ncbi:DUF502 domain-containing protein [Amphibiibacter pelophylacis]|uniref:DUF502 domain-containing protein n=1 Tax=Amphibiibacter pelophylacis TaxID=1799477 RepID=A0ACC6P2C7_9BURK